MIFNMQIWILVANLTNPLMIYKITLARFSYLLSIILSNLGTQMNTKITQLLNIEHPIIQAGMVWVSGWKLASAVSNCGGLGLIGTGSMKSDLLKVHLQKCKAATDNPFGVNIPLLRMDADELIRVCLDEGVKIFLLQQVIPKPLLHFLKKMAAQLFTSLQI